MIVLGIETSCDETSLGLVRDGKEVLSGLIYSQVREHRPFSGVVPEIASRAHVEKINGLFKKALHGARMGPEGIDCIGIVNQPGLVGSLMVGVSFAKSLSLYLEKPLVPVNHLLAHLYANFLKENSPSFPYIGLVVSGGHTLLLIARSHYQYEIIGSTLDDACGEAYDKVAKLLGLGYPGGPVLDRIASRYKGKGISFSAGLLRGRENRYNFSYSGLKTAVLYYIREHPQYDVRPVVKGFQHAAIGVLVEKTRALAAETGIREVAVAGGVAANSCLRELFQKVPDLHVHLPDLKYCTDNGAMVASCAYYMAKGKKFAGADLDVFSKPGGGGRSYLSRGFNL